MSRIDACVATLGRLIAFPSVSSESNLPIIDYLEDALAAAGARCWRMPDETGAKANLFATIGPDAPDGVILSGHTDVVPTDGQPWSSDPFTMVEREGRLYGRGACDMKGFVACAVAMAPVFAAAPLTRPVHFALTYDEETGCRGASALVKALSARGQRAAAAIVGEPTEMRIVDAHKGCYEYETRVTGREGHGSQPDAAVNAAHYAARLATRMIAIGAALKARAPVDSPFSPPWTTLSIGRISGGEAPNVIPKHCEIAWEMRPVQVSDAEFVKREMAEFIDAELAPAMRAVDPEAGIETTTVGEVVGLAAEPGGAAVALLRALTGANHTETVAFGTEAGLFQGIGVPTAICGPGSIAQAHRADEFVAREDLVRTLEMLERLCETLCRPRVGAV